MHLKGVGVENPTTEEGIRLLEMAAKNFDEAQIQLAYMYRFGQEVKKIEKSY